MDVIIREIREGRLRKIFDEDDFRASWDTAAAVALAVNVVERKSRFERTESKFRACKFRARDGRSRRTKR